MEKFRLTRIALQRYDGNPEQGKLRLIQSAFYQDTKKINSLNRCHRLALDRIRQIVANAMKD